MNPFDRLDAMANRAVDVVNDTAFVLVPMLTLPAAKRSPNARATAQGARDRGRDEIRGRGIFDYVSIEAGLQLGVRKSYRESNDLRALQVAREPIVSIDRRRYFADPATLPRQGDSIYFPQKPEVPTFEIVSSQPDGHGRIVLKLVARGKQPDLWVKDEEPTP